MAYPYSALATNKLDSTVLALDHAPHHDALGSALNDLLVALGSNPAGASDVTARLVALEAGIGAGVELQANKNTLGGYVGIDATTGTAQNNRLPPERRFSYSQRALTMFLGALGTQVVKELWITDSMGHQGSSVAQNTSVPARYEAEMARAYNSAPRGLGTGDQPAELWNGVTVTTDGAMAWDDVPAANHAARGSCLANKAIGAGQHATTTRTGSAVQVFYTAYQTNGAVVQVSCNGFTGTTIAAGSNGVNTSTFAGAGTLNVADASNPFWPTAGHLLVATATTPAVVAYTGKTGTTFTGCTTLSGGGVMSTGGAVNPAIDNREPGLPAATFMSGRSFIFTRPSTALTATAIGDISITLTHTGIGTNFELDSGYFFNLNTTTGHMVKRASRSGIQLATWADATQGLPLHQFIANWQPNVVTILCGVNDASPFGGNLSAAATATNLTNLLTKIRAQYGTWTPAIRYIFQEDCTYVPATWPTTYREALRNVCTANDVIFIDGNEAVGSIRVADNLDFSDDSLHPNDKGHRAWGMMMGSHSTNASTLRLNYLNLGALYPQQITAVADRLTLWATSNPSISLYRDPGNATPNGIQLGYFGFRGAFDSFASQTDIAAATAAVAEQTYTPTAWQTGLRFYTTATNTPIIQAGLSGNGDLWVGDPTLAAATWQVSAGGLVQQSSGLRMLGSLMVGNNTTFTYPGTELYGFSAGSITAYRHAQGTRGAPTATALGNALGIIGFEGFDGAAYTGGSAAGGGAKILAQANQNFSNTNQGTILSLYTTPNNTAAVAEVMRLDAPGTVRTNNALTVGGLTARATGAAFEIVSGGVATVRKSTVTLVNGGNTGVTLPTASFVTVTGPSAAFTINTIAGPTDGMIVWIINLTGQNMSILHDDGATGSASQRITSLTGATQTTTGNGAAMLWYDITSARWVLLDFIA